jgi:hypothetical protein
VSLPRFLERVLDAAVPALGAVSRDAVVERLAETAIALHAGRAQGAADEAGFALAANLLARLYPKIHVTGPEELVCRVRAEILLVNPLAELPSEPGPVDATLSYGAPSGMDAEVWVNAAGWTASVDTAAAAELKPAVPAALAAAALGAGEVFRTLFAEELGGRGRHSPQPGAFDLVTLEDGATPTPAESCVPNLGEFALIGAGAVGQAAALTLMASDVHGPMLAVDHECLELSNLQRYVLARDGDVGQRKVDLLHERARGSGLEVVPVACRWHAELADRPRPTLVALDSAEDRIAVQASLPGPLYNAFTQPADIGWSRHESFGCEPCLACLYLPTGRRPALFEQIAVALDQHPRRVLAYLMRGLPVGLPLNSPPEPLAQLPTPADAGRWTEVSLLEDIALAAGVDPGRLEAWRERPVSELYREGICGGALLDLNVGTAPAEALVPLAHQSALAGVMLAAQLIIARTPQLTAWRPTAIEARYDVLTGLPQVLARPRETTAGCICADDVYRAVYADRSSQVDTRHEDWKRERGTQDECAAAT